MRGFDEDNWAIYITAFLSNGITPLKEFRENIYEYKKEFIIDYKGNLLYTISDDLFFYIF
jgi:hypothetical protein